MVSESFASEFMCSTCKRTTPHVATYAGRILVSVVCTVCGNNTHVARPSLRDEYMEDLRLRLASKPHRVIQRFRQHPARFLTSLPLALLRQPSKRLLGR